MKALISPLELVSNGIRIAEVANVSFEVAEPLYWIDCPIDCNANTWYFNTELNQCQPIPIPVPTAQENKEIAIRLLQDTDWTTIPDVANPALSNPYLSNQAEFIAYRNEIRQYAINPIDGNIDWAQIPQEEWKSA